jgi:hypothetical protein
MRHPVRDTRLSIVAAADEIAATARLARVALVLLMIGVLVWLTK